MPKIIIVTGVSRGIGRAIAEQIFESPEAIILGFARSEGPLIELKNKYPGRFEYVAGDVNSSEAIDQLVELATKYGRIDSIIANAGVGKFQTIAQAEIALWREIIDTNFFSLVTLIHKCLPLLRASKGNIIAVSSLLSTKQYRGSTAYAASKNAMNKLIAILVQEEPMIKALSVEPGIVNTDMFANAVRAYDKTKADHLKIFADMRDSGSVVEPEVPAAVYANLAVRGVPEAINGSFLPYYDEKLAAYAA